MALDATSIGGHAEIEQRDHLLSYRNPPTETLITYEDVSDRVSSGRTSSLVSVLTGTAFKGWPRPRRQIGGDGIEAEGKQEEHAWNQFAFSKEALGSSLEMSRTSWDLETHLDRALLPSDKGQGQDLYTI